MRHVAYSSLLVCVFLLQACDSAPGVDDTSSQPPVVSQLEYSPEFVALAALPPSDVTEDSVRFVVQFAVDATDADGSVREVSYAIRSPESSSPVVASGTMASSAARRYSAEADVRIPRGGVGNYTLSVFAVDDVGRMSNTLRGRITFSAEGRPPTIIEVIADPDTIFVQRDSILTLTVVADDPDGIENIARVVVRTPNGSEREMFDDGVSQGDPVAGDGRFTARFEGVNQATPNTTQSFRFQAFDRTGLASEIVEKPVRIE